MPPSALKPALPDASLHVAIIMDGNGRWAARRAMPRAAGHRAGAEAVRRTVEAAPALGVRALTLYAFSADNWQRPPREVASLMRLFRAHLASETPRLIDNGVRLSVIGRRDRLALPLRQAIERAERETERGTTLHLRLAIDYSARAEILRAAAQPRSEGDDALTRERFGAMLTGDGGSAAVAGDVDLLIRTGGEQRLSDFLLWECAYAELYFTDIMWPDFSAEELEDAIRTFHSRERRFGALPAAG